MLFIRIQRKEKQMTFTEQETKMLLNVVSEYLTVFGEAEDTQDYTEYMLANGLGSAVRKLYKGKKGEDTYKRYPVHREGYNYPTFEEWLAEQKHKQNNKQQ